MAHGTLKDHLDRRLTSGKFTQGLRWGCNNLLSLQAVSLHCAQVGKSRPTRFCHQVHKVGPEVFNVRSGAIPILTLFSRQDYFCCQVVASLVLHVFVIPNRPCTLISTHPLTSLCCLLSFECSVIFPACSFPKGFPAAILRLKSSEICQPCNWRS